MTVGIPLIKGRRFDQRDREGAESAAIVNEDLARRFFPDQYPLGKRIRIGASDSQSARLTIVGVVGDTKYNSYGAPGWRVSPMVYRPHRQAPAETLAGRARKRYFVIRATNNPVQLISTVRAEIQALDKNLPLSDIKPLNDAGFDRLRHRADRRRFICPFGTFSVDHEIK